MHYLHLFADPRDSKTVPLNFTKSINLALSERGINSIKHAGVEGLLSGIMADTIPMYGRMIHGKKNGQLFSKSQTYDVHGRSIYAADRGGLNKHLLDALDAMPNVALYFNHKLTGADFRRKRAWLERRELPPGGSSVTDRDAEIEIAFDFLIGADGAYSAARFHLMKFARVDFSQEYIDTLWCEFHIEPKQTDSGSQFTISPGHLHIWPGTEHMFIAIPSSDKSFVCTLFGPHTMFDRLDQDTSMLAAFFAENFPGVSPELISEAELVKQYISNPHLPLISVTCTPYHYKDAGVIIGDAAHAMVPFYGQGMNAGLEDVRVLFDLLDKHGVYSTTGTVDTNSARAAALNSYTKIRTPDATAINGLALRNYHEMRSGVVSPIYLFRKYTEEFLSVWTPFLNWHTQYSRISFSNERYSEVIEAVRRQGLWLLLFTSLTVSSFGGILGWAARRKLSGGLLSFSGGWLKWLRWK